MKNCQSQNNHKRSNPDHYCTMQKANPREGRMLLGDYLIKQQRGSGEVKEVVWTVPDEEF